jgi:type I restriction enzyme S subunit
MKSNYRLLGDFITRVDIRNKDLQTTNLKGLSMKKEFRESTSNIVGVDLSKYKLVPKNHFACDFMSVIRVHKLPVVHQNTDDLIIVSPAYTVFKVIDENVLNPDYLMMWFRRPEFDRYEDFRCDSASRGGFKWDELGEVEIPIPSIEKQRDIVKEYNTIVNRITLNETLNQKLEETAQALYKHWFVDFEFPNEDGKPYKSSCGEMVYNEELDAEIPLGWSLDNIGNVLENLGGGTPKTEVTEYWENGTINWFSPTDITNSNYIFCEKSNKNITDLGLVKSSAKIFPKYSLMMTSRATIGKIGINTTKASTNQGFITLIPNQKYQLYTLVEWLKTCLNEVEQLASGSTFKEINKTDFRNIKIYNTDMFSLLEPKLRLIYKKIENISQQSQILQELQSLLLAKMSKVETKTVEVQSL